jgi:peptide/nickel transport system permease protein
LISNQPVTDGINQRLPVTISLIVGALLVAIPIGVGLGIFSAVKGGVSARALDSFALLGWALPSFWLGAVLIGVFAVRLQWLPAVGYVPLTASPERWFLSLILPVTALALHTVAGIARQTRETMMDSLSSEYVRLAAASGISRRSIIFRHAFKNSAIRVVTILGLLVVGLLGGTIFVETVFALPGVGGLATQATIDHDLPMIQGVVVYFTIIVIIVNLIIDLVYAWLDPRVKPS